MVEQQIRTWEVLDQDVLDLLYLVPREEFVPPQHRSLAFSDIHIPLGEGERMWEPKMEARVLQELTVRKSTDRVLEVGTGSGYLTALLAHRAAHVYSVEVKPRAGRVRPPQSRAPRRREHYPRSRRRGARLEPARPLRSNSSHRLLAAAAARLPGAARRRRAPVRGDGRSAGDERQAGRVHRARRLSQHRPVRDRHRAARQRRAAAAVPLLDAWARSVDTAVPVY